MKNFNRRSSHGHHNRAQSAANWRNTHTDSRGSQAFTHTLTSTQLQPRSAKRHLSYYFSVHTSTGYFRVSVIHRTLTWKTGSLTSVRDQFCMTDGGWAHRQRVSTILTRKTHNCFSQSVLLTVFEPRSFGSRVPRSTS